LCPPQPRCGKRFAILRPAPCIAFPGTESKSGQPTLVPRPHTNPAIPQLSCTLLLDPSRTDLCVRPRGLTLRKYEPRGGRGTGTGIPFFIPPKDTPGLTAHRPPPKPFPEEEIFHSLGLTRGGYPRSGTSEKSREHRRISLDARIARIRLAVGLRTHEKPIEVNPRLIAAAPDKPAPGEQNGTLNRWLVRLGTGASSEHALHGPVGPWSDRVETDRTGGRRRVDLLNPANGTDKPRSLSSRVAGPVVLGFYPKLA